ncbi:hypothetical protein EVAR_90209_1 [Eumeta japonica]|uniref:Uncharacterized protein n=1 Tax=Eumeta variegata TaxID=151549 RepID=A0A4C1WYI8_EUMVA|nr:hypothetical protein EVAR_90209_1 [Eumeta japonica]
MSLTAAGPGRSIRATRARPILESIDLVKEILSYPDIKNKTRDLCGTAEEMAAEACTALAMLDGERWKIIRIKIGV